MNVHFNMFSTVFLIVIFCFVSSAVENEALQALNAQQIWEESLVAKGGRERLHSVRNMVISSSGEYKPLKLKIKPDGEVSSRSGKLSGKFSEELYVFPDMHWSWTDYRPAVFGLQVRMYNYETNTKYVISEGEPNHPAEPFTEIELAGRGFPVIQLMYLMESKWLKPKLVKVTTEKIGVRVVDVVQTEVDGRRYDFAIDRKTHLPVRFTSYSEYKGKVYTYVNGLSDYTDVDGIKVPLTIELEDGHKEKSNIRFNVEYSEKIFTSPPSIEAGYKAWMKSK